jgi:oxygen-independent coproporphyrinogen III oxidase
MINGGIPCFEKEELDQKTRFNEYVMTSLRTMWGIDLAYIEKQFEKEGYDYVLNIASKFLRYGMLNQEKNALVLTNQGLLCRPINDHFFARRNVVRPIRLFSR